MRLTDLCVSKQVMSRRMHLSRATSLCVGMCHKACGNSSNPSDREAAPSLRGATGQGFKGKRFRWSFSRKAVFWGPSPSSRRKWLMAYGRQRFWIRDGFLVLMHFRYPWGPQQMYQKNVSSLYESRDQISSAVQFFSCVSYLTSFVFLSPVLQGQDFLTSKVLSRIHLLGWESFSDNLPHRKWQLLVKSL